MDRTGMHRVFRADTAGHTPTHGTSSKIYKTQRYICLQNMGSMKMSEIISCILSDHSRIKLRNQTPENLFDRHKLMGINQHIIPSSGHQLNKMNKWPSVK